MKKFELFPDDNRLGPTKYLVKFLTLSISMFVALLLFIATSHYINIDTNNQTYEVIKKFILGLCIIAEVMSCLYCIIRLFIIQCARFHDVNSTGWLCILLYIFTSFPFIGIIFWLFFVFRSGTKGENRFGPEPKEKSTKLDYFLASIAVVLFIMMHLLSYALSYTKNSIPI